MSDVVETRRNGDIYEVLVKPNHNAQAQEQEVKDCSEFLKIGRSKYRKYRMIFEGIQECIEDEKNLDPDLRAKINEIVLSKELPQRRLNDCNSIENLETLLGVPMPTTELTYSESNRLRSCLKAKFENKCSQVLRQYHSLFDKHTHSSRKNTISSPLDLDPDDRILLEYRDKLRNEQEIYLTNQLQLLEILEEMKDIRLKIVPEIADRKYEECALKTHINYLKSELVRNKCRIDIFTETSDSFKAYTEILNDLKAQQHDLLEEIKQLKDLKEKYANVSCKEYDDILKSYLQYKSSLEKKKLMYELLG